MPGDAGIFAAVAVTGAFEHAADDEALLREQLFVHAHQRAGLVGRTFPGAKACAVLMASFMPRIATVNSTT